MLQRDPTIPYFQPRPGQYRPPQPDKYPLNRLSMPQTGLILRIVAGCLIIGAIWGSLVHYFGPVSTVQAYMQASLVAADGHAAYSILCPEAQATVTQSQMQAYLDTFRLDPALANASIAALTHTLVDESFFREAHVRVSGSASVDDRAKKVVAFGDPAKNVLIVQASGLGWCLTDSNLTVSSP
jgi:hypothetical protein